MSWLTGSVLAVILAAPMLANARDVGESSPMRCRESEPSSGHRLRVRLTVKSNDAAALRDAIQAIVDRTWGQAGLQFEWLASSGPDLNWDGVDAWILAAHAPLVTLDAPALGAVVFNEHALPSPLIRVSIDAVVAWVSRDQRTRFHRFSGPLTPALGDTALLVPQALGYAAAHEIGHFVLASKEHARSGLMQAALTTPGALFDSGSFVLDAVNRQKLRTRLMERTGCVSVASPMK